MKRFLKIIIKIILIFLFFYILVAAFESIFDMEVEPYMIFAFFIITAASLGWTEKQKK